MWLERQSITSSYHLGFLKIVETGFLKFCQLLPLNSRDLRFGILKTAEKGAAEWKFYHGKCIPRQHRPVGKGAEKAGSHVQSC